MSNSNAETILKKNVDNYTKSELKVLNALRFMAHPTAEDIYFKINTDSQDEKIGLTSVYRALKKLDNNCEVKQVNLINDGKTRYEINADENHHHHFICVSCNAIKVIDFCPFDSIRDNLGSGYAIKSHNFEIFGLCPECNK